MKVVIIDCGFVGSLGAYAMALKSMASEIVFVDLKQKLSGENILRAIPFNRLFVPWPICKPRSMDFGSLSTPSCDKVFRGRGQFC